MIVTFVILDESEWPTTTTTTLRLRLHVHQETPYGIQVFISTCIRNSGLKADKVLITAQSTSKCIEAGVTCITSLKYFNTSGNTIKQV